MSIIFFVNTTAGNVAGVGEVTCCYFQFTFMPGSADITLWAETVWLFPTLLYYVRNLWCGSSQIGAAALWYMHSSLLGLQRQCITL